MKKLLIILVGAVLAFASCNKKNDNNDDFNLAEKIIGKWVEAEVDGHVALTDEQTVTTFISTTVATVSGVRFRHNDSQMVWNDSRLYEVKIEGHNVTLTTSPNPGTTLINELNVKSITNTGMVCRFKHSTIHNGETVDVREHEIRYEKVTKDFGDDIYGMWECDEITGGYTYNDPNGRLDFHYDGTYDFYVKNETGEWTLVIRELNEYIIDGNWFALRWKEAGQDMRFEVWDIDNVDDGNMQWSAWRKDGDGTTYLQGVKWQKVNRNGIAMIVKNEEIDYWRQIEAAFRAACQEADMEAYYYATSAENAYQEQIEAVEELSNLPDGMLKGIIFAPSFGINGESAEAEVADLAMELEIPVVIIDSPVDVTSPLADCPYFGTDNTEAGLAMADKVDADFIAAFAMTNSPGVERAIAFQTMKPDTEIYLVGDEAVEEVEAVIDDYNDFVFFNGNDLVDVIDMLDEAGKNMYTFDVYEEFLDELIEGCEHFKGIMAQNTFLMSRKAVEAVLNNASQGEMVPTFYITKDNLNDPNVIPFLEFYHKR